MTTSHWPDHLLTLDEWDALPEDNSRHYELVEGVLFVSPKPAPLHQRAMYRLTAQLDDQLPDELTALPDVEITVEAAYPATIRAPDVVVTHAQRAEANHARLDADDVILAVEIVSPGTKRTDHVTKLAEYSEAGIEHYWVVDVTAPTTVTAYRLVDGVYEIVADNAEPFSLSEPTPLTIDPTRLTSRR
ncbi:Uma2 family endonuclease [Haloechinothrix halophila]|uniref:Uma2 family endonuclease n=1 Tax=Haloechinothrix halophila TaxID=1069073 RepID=UPI0004129A95|nr:Uma2 family endonuclease [Haloechinothrix halophila]